MDDEMYAKGFCWVMLEYHLNNENLDFLKSITFKSEDPFDKGANRAIMIIEDASDNRVKLCSVCQMPIIRGLN